MLPMRFRRFKLFNRTDKDVKRVKLKSDTDVITVAEDVDGKLVNDAIPRDYYNAIEIHIGAGSQIELTPVFLQVTFKVKAPTQDGNEVTYKFTWGTPPIAGLQYFQEFEAIIHSIELDPIATVADAPEVAHQVMLSAELSYHYWDDYEGAEYDATAQYPAALEGQRTS